MLDNLKKEWKESGEKARASKERDRLLRQDKKRREAFPGKYGKQFYHIILKNFLFGWRDYSLLILCGVITSSFFFALFGSYQMLAYSHSKESLSLLWTGSSEGLQAILKNAIVSMGICLIFLMIYVLIFYLRRRMKSYSILATLGIRKKILYVVPGVEIGLTFLASLVLGALLGKGITWFLCWFISRNMDLDLALASINGSTYLLMVIATAAVYLASFAGIDFISDFSPITATARTVKSERLPRKGCKILALAGIVLALTSILRFCAIKNFEKLSLILLFGAGIFLICRFGGALYLHREKQGKRYLSTLLERNHLYHRSSTCAWYLMALTVIHLGTAFYFTFPAVSISAAESPEELFPYDLMCIADDEDEEFFQQLEERYDIEVITYPMVRVTNADKTEKTEAIPIEGAPPQGQQIGISESTYNQLKKAVDPDYQGKSLGLDAEGKKIYVVHQQDSTIKAQPVDWLYFKNKPFLHIGLPCKAYNPEKVHALQAFPQYTIAGEEISSLTGCFRQGILENLVVFSDEYFEVARKQWKRTDYVTGYPVDEGIPMKTPVFRQGPTTLVLIRMNSGNIEDLEQEVSILNDRHEEDFELSYDNQISCWYSSGEATLQIKTERVLKQIIHVFVILILTVAGIFLLLIKNLSEVQEKKERSAFLSCMGMPGKERCRLLRKEIALFFRVPAVVSTIGAVCFTLATFHVRAYTAELIKDCIILLVPIWAAYFLIQWMVIGLLKQFMVRKVEGRHE